jgi:hypothetical protein
LSASMDQGEPRVCDVSGPERSASCCCHWRVVSGQQNRHIPTMHALITTIDPEVGSRSRHRPRRRGRTPSRPPCGMRAESSPGDCGSAFPRGQSRWPPDPARAAECRPSGFSLFTGRWLGFRSVFTLNLQGEHVDIVRQVPNPLRVTIDRPTEMNNYLRGHDRSAQPRCTELDPGAVRLLTDRWRVQDFRPRWVRAAIDPFAAKSGL